MILVACGNSSSGSVDAPAMKTACGNAGLTCDYPSEICVEQTPIGPGQSYACQPIPSDCTNDRTCGCAGATLCTGTFSACFARPAPNTIACECPQCQ